MTIDDTWKGSRFNRWARDSDGVALLYNSLNGSLARVPEADEDVVRIAESDGIAGLPGGILAELALNGFFVPELIDENHVASSAQVARYQADDALELILLPNENCNFRCVYCYESFLRGKMRRPVIEGIVALVERQAETLRSLRVGWFGGEPLTAPNIIEEVSTRLQAIAAEHDIEYSSSMVTNGYFLTAEIRAMLFRAEVRQFQVTVDGPQQHHDRLRVLADGKTGTFDRIMGNLTDMAASDDVFQLVVRVNFDDGSKDEVSQLLHQLESIVSGDPRFAVDFHPVGQWGGPHDADLAVCDADDGHAFMQRHFVQASESGMSLKALRQRLAPFGSVCYAANPHSFVIGSEGTVYKCTVAFEDPRNHVGRLTADGDLVLDDAKFRMWTASGAEHDSGCQSCFFRPSCQGNACPLERMNTGQAPCPSTKTSIDDTLRILADDATRQVLLGMPTMPSTG